MKEYTTLEMIEEIYKDFTLKFQTNLLFDGKRQLQVYYDFDNCQIKWVHNKSTFPITLDTYKAKWTKVQQVPFIEAAKAFHKGKIIKVDYQNGKATNTYDPHKNGTLTDNHGGGITTDEILEGTWYIEE